MNNKIHFEKISEFQSYCERNFSEISANEILIALGAGFDIATYKTSPSWNTLNGLGLEKANPGFEDLLNEPRILALGPHLLSSYVFKKLNRKRTKENALKKETPTSLLLKPLENHKIINKNEDSLRSIGLSYASIITTNYRLPQLFNENRIKVNLTELNVNSFEPKMIFAHGEMGTNNIVYSDEQFKEHYSGSRHEKMAETLRTQGTKLVVLFGFSGRDTAFMELIRDSFKNQEVQIILFTGDFNINKREAELFDDILKTLYEFKLITYNYLKAPLLDMVKTILLSSKGNTRAEISGDQWSYIIDETSKIKTKKLNFIFKKIQSPSLWYDIRILAKYISTLNPSPKEIMESKFNNFTKLTIFEQIIIEGKSDKKVIESFLSIRTNDLISEPLATSLLKFIDECKNDLLKGEILFTILVKDRKSKKPLKSNEYILIKKYLVTMNKNEDWSEAFVDTWPQIEINTMSEVDKVLATLSCDAMSVSMDLLNLRQGDEMNSIISSLQRYFSTIKSQSIEKYLLTLSSKIKNDTYNDPKSIQWKIIGYSYITFVNKKVKLSNIWSSNHKKFSELIVYFSKYWEKIDIDNPQDFDELIKKPENNFMYGMMSKSIYWQKNMLAHIEQNETWIEKYKTRKNRYLKAIKEFDLAEVDSLESEIRNSWRSRKRGDGKVDSLEREYDWLIKKNNFDLDHVYQSWLNNKNIELDEKIINLFVELENLSEKTLFKVYEKYKKIKSISTWIQLNSKDIIIKSKKNISIEVFEMYIETFVNKIEFGKNLNDVMTENKSFYFGYNTRNIIEILKDTQFVFNNDEQRKPNHQKNLLIFERFLIQMELNETQKDILKLSNAYYIFKDSKKPSEILRSTNANKHYAWNILNSNVTYYLKEDNIRLANFYKTIKYKEPTHSNNVIRYNQKHYVGAIFYKADMIDEIIGVPELVDILIKFVYINKKISKNYKKNNELMKGANFSKTSLQRMREEELLAIPKSIFKKIMEISQSIKFKKIIEYTNSKPEMQNNKKVLRRIHNGSYNIKDYELRTIEYMFPEISPKNKFFQEARISIK